MLLLDFAWKVESGRSSPMGILAAVQCSSAYWPPIREGRCLLPGRSVYISPDSPPFLHSPWKLHIFLSVPLLTSRMAEKADDSPRKMRKSVTICMLLPIIHIMNIFMNICPLFAVAISINFWHEWESLLFLRVFCVLSPTGSYSRLSDLDNNQMVLANRLSFPS